MTTTAERGYRKDELLRAQGSRCAICGVHAEVTTAMHLDHDHSCCDEGCRACVRGVLCWHCNVGLGHFKDSPDFLRYAACYLDGRDDVQDYGWRA